MKHVWQHPQEPKTGKKFWRSFGQLAKTPASTEWLDREFRDGAAEMKSEDELEASRRTFMKLMGASTALAGLSSCHRPELNLLPFAKAPEWGIPGRVLFYTSAMPRAGGGTPVVVHTHEGRPTHLQGNKLNSDSAGLDCQAQASILNLYDPARTRTFLNFGKEAKRMEFLKMLDAIKGTTKSEGIAAKTPGPDLLAQQGKGLAILIDEAVTPTRQRLLGEVLKAYPQAKLYRHETFGQANVEAAYGQAFAPGAMPVYHFEKADRVFSLDSDFLGLDRISGNATARFMSRRKADSPEDSAKMNRLYVAEARYSITGGLADHRLRVHASQMLKFTVDLAKAVAEKTGDAALTAAAAAAKLAGAYEHPRKKDFADTELSDAKKAFKADYDSWVKLAAEDLAAAKGHAIVVTGTQHSPAQQALVIAINQALGSFGATISLRQAVVTPAGNLEALAAAASSINTLIIIGETDPVLEAPGDIANGGLAAALKAIPNILVHAQRPASATAALASWVIPATHYLEQWGDTLGFDGSYTVVQPMIAPLFKDSMSDIELLQALIAAQPVGVDAPPAEAPLPGAPVDPGPAAKAVRDTFNTLVTGADDNKWNNALRDGAAVSNPAPVAAALNAGAIATLIGAAADVELKSGDWEVTFNPCAKIHDGRYINNGWLQEAPDPVSKVTWDNVALISVKSAKALGVNLFNEDSADVIEIQLNGKTRHFPVLVIPGHADNSVTLTVGYGQRDTGLVAKGSGFDAYGLRSKATPYFAVGAKVARLTTEATGITDVADRTSIPAVYPLGLTAEHHSMYGRAIVREGTVKDWAEDKDFVLTQGSDAHLHAETRKEKEALNSYSFYKPEGLAGEDGKRVSLLPDETHQWGMVIDLNKCTGCTSCLVACQSENNIPIVGKDQVIRGREMHWIRMDRYFATDLNSDGALNHREVEPDAWNEDQMDEPEMLMQPMGCQHCEAAPCETVCPVNATVHSPDGLNLMVYNRCIGTRYCANNCPFKARRFNFFDYNKRNPLVKQKVGGLEFGNLYAGPAGARHDTELSKLQKNPAVTVRMRGVIEKCTYCIQRITTGHAAARGNARKAKMRATGLSDENLVLEEKDLMIPTDSVKTACQESCPAEAIAFGNIKDKDSTVSRWKANSRNYEVLGYLNVRARTTYLARIKNPNPALMAASGLEASKVGEGSRTRVVAPAGHSADAAAH